MNMMKMSCLLVDTGPLDEVPQSWKGIKRFYDYATICAVTEDGTQLHDPHSAEEVREIKEKTCTQAVPYTICDCLQVAFWQVIIQDRVLRTKALNELLVSLCICVLQS